MFFRIIVVLLISIVSLQTTASGDAIETALENCNQVESPLAIAVACDVHIHCLFNTATVNCSETTLVHLTQSCDNLAIIVCVDIATLTMIAMDDAILSFQSIDSTTQLNNSLIAFLAGDYQTAIDLYENVTLSLDYFPHTILELGLGILYLRIDNPDVALIQFDKSLNLEFYNPIAFYYRGNTYEQHDNSVRALRDHYMYDLLADSQVKITLPLRSFRIQIPDSRVWNLFPVYTMQQGVNKFVLHDDTQELAQSIVVSLLDNDETLVIADWLDIVAGTDTEILFLERDPQNPLRYILNINQQDVPDNVLSGKTEISAVVSPNTIELYLRSMQGYDTLLITNLANMAFESDVRLPNSKRVCEGLPLALLEIGLEIQPLPPQTQLTLWDDPFVDDPLDNIDNKAKSFTVIDDPVCYDNRIWWQVSNGTVTGWLPENSGLPEDNYSIISIELADLWKTNPPSPLQFLGLGTTSN
jgi:tetratricopeptide (TPR) repeat protein